MPSYFSDNNTALKDKIPSTSNNRLIKEEERYKELESQMFLQDKVHSVQDIFKKFSDESLKPKEITVIPIFDSDPKRNYFLRMNIFDPTEEQSISEMSAPHVVSSLTIDNDMLPCIHYLQKYVDNTKYKHILKSERVTCFSEVLNLLAF